MGKVTWNVCLSFNSKDFTVKILGVEVGLGGSDNKSKESDRRFSGVLTEIGKKR